MFALSDLIDYALDASQIERNTADFGSLAGREYTFPVQGVRSVRLPRDTNALDKLLAGPGGAAAFAALTQPQTRIPLVDEARGLRGFAACVAINSRGSSSGSRDEVIGGEHEAVETRWPTLVFVSVMIRDGKRRHDPVEIESAQVSLATEPDEMIQHMARLYERAAPEARKAFQGVSAVWLGGAPGDANRLVGTAAAGGFRMECVADPARHLRTINDRLGSKPPDCLIVWGPRAAGAESLVVAYRAMRPDGEVIELQEYDVEDIAIEFTMVLQELGYVSPSSSGPEAEDTPAPAVGEQRFYIKLYGRKTGDVMKEVEDCAHNQWGGDQRRKAPRAYKGIAHQVGHNPTKLFLCANCTKHRWRARF